jgi:hypothetical protein
MALTGAISTLALVTAVVWYYFTPSFWEVGYQPTQPIAYSHQLHAGTLGIDCRYCHSDVGQSKYSNVPTTDVCMNCHAVTGDSAGYLALALTQDGTSPSPHWTSVELQRLRTAHDAGESPGWRRVHKLPDYAHFNHAAHVNAGVSCYSCHMRVDQMPVVHQTQSLAMGWCLDCHRAPESQLIDTTEVRVTDLAAVELLLSDPGYATSTGLRLAENVNPPENCSACHY